MFKNLFQSVIVLSLTLVTAAVMADPMSNGTEIMLAPGLGYSTYSGLVYSGAVGVATSVSSRVQLFGRALFEGSTSGNGSNSGFQIGPIYNFSDEFSRSGFLSAGVGYQTHFPGTSDDSSAYGYAGGGYRWLISERNRISYSPYAQVSLGRDSKGSIQIEFLNFSIFF